MSPARFAGYCGGHYAATLGTRVVATGEAREQTSVLPQNRYYRRTPAWARSAPLVCRLAIGQVAHFDERSPLAG